MSSVWSTESEAGGREEVMRYERRSNVWKELRSLSICWSKPPNINPTSAKSFTNMDYGKSPHSAMQKQCDPSTVVPPHCLYLQRTQFLKQVFRPREPFRVLHCRRPLFISVNPLLRMYPVILLTLAFWSWIVSAGLGDEYRSLGAGWLCCALRRSDIGLSLPPNIWGKCHVSCCLRVQSNCSEMRQNSTNLEMDDYLV